ncbi:MAG: DUF1376 domain-containing protein [Patescibacteria group bacterium]|nr:DUF1376 domain-containing protein [Patescibacteria group bacterium]
MTDIAPLTAAECNLQDFAFMPLDVARLRDSDLAANETPEACWAAVLLWAAAWHQVPAASIPNDERWIAKHAGYAQRGKIAREWADVRAGALRGWIECSDGRLYHPVVAEKAREAWQAKLEQRWRSECARIKKHNDRHPGADVGKPTFEYWVSQGCPVGQPLSVPGDTNQRPQDKPGDIRSKGQGEGQGQGDSYSVPIGTEPPDGSSAAAKPTMTALERRKSEAWRGAKSLLNAHGMPKAQTGTFVGKLVTEYGADVVLEVLESAVLQLPAEPDAWMRAACQRRVGQRSPQQSFAERDREAGMARWEAMTGQTHPERTRAAQIIDITPATPASGGGHELTVAGH